MRGGEDGGDLDGGFGEPVWGGVEGGWGVGLWVGDVVLSDGFRVEDGFWIVGGAHDGWLRLGFSGDVGRRGRR